jgi:subtilisin family serine protease
MVLKAVNNFGHSRASFLAQAIAYAVDNGARIINLSVGGAKTTLVEKAALDYAAAKGVLVVVAAGNEGEELDSYGAATHPAALTVAATGPDDKRVPFSNWGSHIALAAPGVDILSLRAQRTDTMRDVPGLDYEPGAAYVGGDKRYYRATGTSFSAPIVTGIASLLLSRKPELSASDLRRILLNSATDIDTPGIDQLTGYGLVDARRALLADPRYFVAASIDAVSVVARKGGHAVRLTGTADADRFSRAWLELGKGESPSEWKKVGAELRKPVRGGTLGDVDTKLLQGAAQWTLRVITEHEDGTQREVRFALDLG